MGYPTFDKIWAEVRENNRRWRECPRHLFEAWNPDERKFGEKLTCKNCGASEMLNDIARYIEGYKAAGGDPNDIMPNWDK